MDSNFIKFKIDKINCKLIKLEKLINCNLNYRSQKYLSLMRKYKKFYKIKSCFDIWKKYSQELDSLRILIHDKELNSLAKDEYKKVSIKVNFYFNKLKKYFLCLSKSSKDILNAYLEIYAGTGGNEASLFVYDLFKMYTKYSELMNWKVELINFHSTDLKGYKEIVMKIIGKNVYGKLKFESGGHRVQRVPYTESQGRVHTSTCIVAVIPDIPKVDLPILRNEDLKIDTFRSSGSGGQHVNTTDSAVRITHLPTKIVVECQQERSQHKNKSKALEVLKARIYSYEMNKKNKKNFFKKKKLLGTGYRSDRNRTYNFTQNRITDHRINFTTYSLNEVLNGKLDLLIMPLIKKYEENI